MRKKTIFLGLTAIISFAYYAYGNLFEKSGQEPLVIKNLAKPRLGTVVLDVESSLRIDPYQDPSFGSKSYSFVRGEDGSVILYSYKDGAAFRYSSQGKVLGPLSRQGQGPGEIGPGLALFWFGQKIVAFSNGRQIVFDSAGRFLEQRRTSFYPSAVIDEKRHLTIRREGYAQGKGQPASISLVEKNEINQADEKTTDIYGPIIPGVPTKNGFAFEDSWGTPNLCFGYDHARQKVLAGTNRAYRISVMNLSGRVEKIIEKVHRPVKVERRDIEDAYQAFMVVDPAAKEILDIYPSTYAALWKIQVLKNGYVLVYRIAKMRMLEIDVFNPDGGFDYVLLPPAKTSFEYAVFHEQGFALTVEEGDYKVYRDIRIKNLPSVFR
jgi:hypothetical protein